MLKHSFFLLLLFIAPFLAQCTSGLSDVVVQNNASTTTADALTLGTNYLIASARDPNKCLASVTSTIDNGTKLTLADCDKTTSQTWLRTNTNSSFALLTSKCLDVTDGSTNNGSAVQLWDCATSNTNQRWTYKGGQLVWMAHTTKCLDLVNGVTDPNAALQLWDCDTGNNNQQWKMISTTGASSTASTANTSAVVASSVQATATDLNGLTAGLTAQVTPIFNAWTIQDCLDVHNVETSPYVQTYTCNGSFTQSFGLTAAGQITFPSADVVENGITYPKGKYCVSSAPSSSVSGQTIASLAVCNTADANQTWGQTGNQFVSIKNKLCLDFNIIASNANNLILTPCTSAPSQTWTAGDSNAAWAAFQTSVANMTVAQRCPTIVYVIDQSGNSLGAQKLLNLYGGQEALQTALAKFLQDDCAVIYNKATDMPQRLAVTVVFDTNNSAAAYTLAGPSSQVHVNSQWFESFAPTDAPLKFKTDAMFHHEFAHVMQHKGAGLASGLYEGHANWVAYKAGYIYDTEKVKGGAWTDGYSTTAFFLLYLDSMYSPLGTYQAYTWRLNLAVRDLENSNGAWTTQYFVDTTGKSIDTLWAEYQSTF